MDSAVRKVLSLVGITENLQEFYSLSSKADKNLTIEDIKNILIEELERRNTGFIPEVYILSKNARKYKKRLNDWDNIASKFYMNDLNIFRADLIGLGFADIELLNLEEILENHEKIADFISLLDQEHTELHIIKEKYRRGENKDTKMDEFILLLGYLIQSTTQWLFSFYEILRTFREYLYKRDQKNFEKKFPFPFQDLNIIFYILERVRMPLAKYQLKGKKGYYNSRIAFPKNLGIGFKVEDIIICRRPLVDLLLNQTL